MLRLFQQATSLVLWLMCVLTFASSARAQDTPPPAPEGQPIVSAPMPSDDSEEELQAGGGYLTGRWIPLGPAPVDQAGGVRRGYVLPMEDSQVTAPGRNHVGIHAVAANYFYREQTDDFLITQRYEAHTIALDYRRGFKIAGLPAIELGGHVQLHRSNAGMLNGFIAGFENLWVALTGNQSSKNELRTSSGTAPPQGTSISRNGSPLYRDVGNGSGIGDLYVLAKLSLLDGAPASTDARVAARFGLNLAGSSEFAEGNFFGLGLSLDKKLSEWVAFHGDVRATRVLDEESVWNLPLKPWTYGFSIGPELKLPFNSSFGVQFSGSSTPYLRTRTRAFDKAYGDITMAWGHRFRVGARSWTTHVYARENMNLPFQVRWNTDPDLSVGLKFTIH